MLDNRNTYGRIDGRKFSGVVVMHAQTQKLSVSIQKQQFEFIEHYKAEHHYQSRSEVIKKAIALLQQSTLEACYQEANKEIDDAWDSTAADGVDDEAW